MRSEGTNFVELEQELHRTLERCHVALRECGCTPKQSSKQLTKYTAAIIRGIDARFPR